MVEILGTTESLKIGENKIKLEGDIELLVGKYNRLDAEEFREHAAYDIAIQKGFLGNDDVPYSVRQNDHDYVIFHCKPNSTGGFEDIEVGRVPKCDINVPEFTKFIRVLYHPPFHSMEEAEAESLVEAVNQFAPSGIQAKVHYISSSRSLESWPGGIEISSTSEHSVKILLE